MNSALYLGGLLIAFMLFGLLTIIFGIVFVVINSEKEETDIYHFCEYEEEE